MRVLHYADLETAADHPERVARLAGLIHRRRGDDAVVTGGGDNTAPGVLSLETGGRHALDVFERVRPDLDTLGNHDFDNGIGAIEDVVDESPQTWVCANLRRDGEPIFREAGVVPWTVLERAGERLGVVGLAAPATPEITPPAAPLTALDPVSTARESVAALREADVDWVVALSHLGRGDDRLARALDLDAILGGHAHEPRIERVAGTLVVRPGATASGVVELRLGEAPSATRHEVADAPVDEALAAGLREQLAETGLSTVVAEVPEPVPRTRAAIRGRESSIGRFLAGAYRAATGADVGLQNSGGVREGPPLAGEVTAADVVGVVPFEEPVGVGELTGRELRAVLAEQRAGDSGTEWIGHASGASVGWNGESIERVAVDGDALDPDATYRLATSEYLFGTPHEFPTLAERHLVSRTDRTQYEVVLDHVRAAGLNSGAVTRATDGTPGAND